MKRNKIKLFEEFQEGETEAEYSGEGYGKLDFMEVIQSWDEYLRLGYEQDMVQEFLDSYDDGSYTEYPSDGASETAERYMEIYNAELWKLYGENFGLSGWLEEAFEEGLIDTSSKNFSMITALQIGQLQYNEAVIRQVMEAFGIED